MNDIVYLGTSGIALPEPGKQFFPEEFRDKSRLTYYASLFNSLEVNSTFSKIPMAKTVARWADEVPKHFRFTFKFPREITHNKDLKCCNELLRQFFEVIGYVGEKKGCLLVQFPGRVDITRRKDVKALLISIQSINQPTEWKIAIEFRNQSWYNPDVFDLIKQSKMTLVLHDLPPAPPPLYDGSDFVYLRFHGPEKGYRGSYSDQYLSGWAERVTSWSKNGREVYVYFNNTLGQAAQNVLALQEQLGDRPL